VCGAPATIIAIEFLPISLFAAIFSTSNQPQLAILNLAVVLASTFALVSYWHWVIQTANGKAVKFGLNFALAVIASALSAWAVFNALPVFLAFGVVIPIFAATGWLISMQRNFKRSKNA
jgi:hypothetical protein